MSHWVCALRDASTVDQFYERKPVVEHTVDTCVELNETLKSVLIKFDQVCTLIQINIMFDLGVQCDACR